MKRNAIIIIVTVLMLAAIGFCTWWFCFRKTNDVEDSSHKIVFQKNDGGENIKRLQIALNSKGYNLDVDGVWGKATDKAVFEYFGKSTVTLADIQQLEGL